MSLSASLLYRSAPRVSLPQRLGFLLSVLILAASFSYFLANCWTLRDLLVDDSYITYRWGYRLAVDHALRWNLLEKPAMCFTTPSGILVSAGFEVLGLDLLLAWKALSVLLMAGCVAAGVWGAWVFCRAHLPAGNRWGLPLLIGACVCAGPLGAVHAMSGMETLLFAFLLMALTALSFQILFGEGSRPLLLDLLAGGLFLLTFTRPEGGLWGAIVGLTVFCAISGERRPRLMRAALLYLLLPGMLYLAFCRIAFGTVVPTVLMAKTASAARDAGMGRLHTYLPSHWLIWQFVRDNWLLFGALAVAAAVAHLVLLGVRNAAPRFEAFRAALCLGGLLGASLLCIGYFSSVHMLMGYGHRYLYPFGQTLLLILLLPACTLVFSLARQSRILFVLFLAVLVFSLVRVGQHVWRDGRATFVLAATNNRRLDGYTRAGRALDAVARRAGRQMVLFHHNMGELMYAAPRWDAIDPVGLISEDISRQGFSVDAVFRRKPELLLLPSKSKREITPYRAELAPDISYSVIHDPRARGYAYLGYFPDLSFFSEGAMHFFVARDLLAREPWVGPYLSERLQLRVDSQSH